MTAYIFSMLDFYYFDEKKNEDFGQSLSLLSAMQCGKAILVSSINFQMLNVLTQNIMIMAKRVPP